MLLSTLAVVSTSKPTPGGPIGPAVEAVTTDVWGVFNTVDPEDSVTVTEVVSLVTLTVVILYTPEIP